MGGDIASKIEAGLPDIIGSIGNGGWGSYTGAFIGGVGVRDFSLGTNTRPNITIKASAYNKIYGASNTVQPPSFLLLPQIKY